VSCTGPTETFTITVNPTAQVEANDSQVLQLQILMGRLVIVGLMIIQL